MKLLILLLCLLTYKSVQAYDPVCEVADAFYPVDSQTISPASISLAKKEWENKGFSVVSHFSNENKVDLQISGNFNSYLSHASDAKGFFVNETQEEGNVAIYSVNFTDRSTGLYYNIRGYFDRERRDGNGTAFVVALERFPTCTELIEYIKVKEGKELVSKIFY